MQFENIILNLSKEEKVRYLHDSLNERNFGMFHLLSTILSLRDKKHGGIDKKEIDLIYQKIILNGKTNIQSSSKVRVQKLKKK